ncbi:MAG: Gx transporter family protein [Nitrospirae bacterium]|nr:Gx transporter family protein [Nitrospirota bacterium]MCL5422163.1 Gx transporter family protein [Nitrospirota bacterium]
MQLQDKYRIAILSAYALALHGFESLIPMPIPWIRVGLANIITVAAFILFGFRAAMMVTLVRVFIASLFTGSFLGPGFILSLGGGVSGILAMGFVLSLLPGLFGPVGLSLIGALFHNLAQLFLAYILFIQKIEPVLIITPVLILIGTVTGLVNGLVADLLVKGLKNSGVTIQNTPQ